MNAPPPKPKERRRLLWAFGFLGVLVLAAGIRIFFVSPEESLVPRPAPTRPEQESPREPLAKQIPSPKPAERPPAPPLPPVPPHRSLGGFRESEKADEAEKKPEEIEAPHQQSETATRRLAEEAAQARVHSVYQSQCADCHGATGRGADAALAKVSGAPQDFSDPEYWAKIDRDDEVDRLEQAILDGKWKTGGSRRMPPFRGQLSDEEVKLMIGYLRGMAGVKEADKKP